jgi:NADPH2:quinone reductase
VRRVRYHEYGGPEVLKIEEADVPAPGDRQVLIRAEVIGANFVDTKFRQGPTSGAIFGRPLPGSPTGDVVGIVESVGAGVDPALVGRRVAAQVREAAPNGVDVVLDSVGGAILHESIGLLAPLGRAVIYGAASGDLADIPVASLFELRSVTGFSTLAWRAAAPKQAAADVAEVTEHFAAGRLRTTVHTRLPLAEAVAAHRLLDDRAQMGRILLVP